VTRRSLRVVLMSLKFLLTSALRSPSALAVPSTAEDTAVVRAACISRSLLRYSMEGPSALNFSGGFGGNGRGGERVWGGVRDK